MTAEDILEVLEELNQEEFEKFKWFLQQPEILSGLPTVKRKRLEGAKTLDIVDLMVQIYTLERCMEVTCKILGKVNRNDLRTRFLSLLGSGCLRFRKSQRVEFNNSIY
uniref:Pyrin domain-containing protein n=1 Tax=Poecilia reticulata TaxID=8081 RepID=A0A3P9Q363_POERE